MVFHWELYLTHIYIYNIEVWALFWRVGSLEEKANQLGSRYLGVSKKYGYPKLDGLNNFNEKPYENG